MTPDQLFVLGMVIGAISIPATIAAWSEKRRPRVPAIAMMTGGVLMLIAFARNPGGYTVGDLPDVIYGVLGGLLGG